jgi:hypothetical protein
MILPIEHCRWRQTMIILTILWVTSGPSLAQDAGSPQVEVESPLTYGRFLSLIPTGGTGEISVTPDGALTTRNMRSLGASSTPARATVRETSPTQGQPVENDYDLTVTTQPLTRQQDGRAIEFIKLSIRFTEDNQGGTGNQVLERSTTGQGQLAITLQAVNLPSRDQPGNLEIGGTIEVEDEESGQYTGGILIEAIKHHQ